MTLVDRLAKVFDKAFQFDSGRFSSATVPEDVPNWDSIGHMNLVMQLQEEFGQEFQVDEIMEMTSVARIIEILKARGVES